MSSFWKEKGLDYIVPKKGGTNWPEGFDVLSELTCWLGGEHQLAEVGCGTGRLAPAFRPEQYHGYDINPAALDIARQTNPAHRFTLMEEGEQIEAPAILLYTVCLHIPDDKIHDLITSMKCERLMIAEIMDRRYRKPRIVEGDVPGCNRLAEEYESFGKVLRRQDFIYSYYPGAMMTWILLDMTEEGDP